MEVGNEQLSRDLIVAQDNLALDLRHYSSLQPETFFSSVLYILYHRSSTMPQHVPPPTGNFRKDSLSRQSYMAVGSRLLHPVGLFTDGFRVLITRQHVSRVIF